MVVAGLWTALSYPFVFIAFLSVFVILLIWLLPRIWIGIRKLFGYIARLFRRRSAHVVQAQKQLLMKEKEASGIVYKLNKLQLLFEKGLITRSEK